MAMRRDDGVQDDLIAIWSEIPRSPGHAFYDRLQKRLREAGFDAFVEDVCKPYYAAKMGAPSLPPGRYFRMHMVGYFEGIDSERGIAWRCADSFSLRDFLRLSSREKVPDHSWMSRTRARLPHEAHEQVFDRVLKLVAERGLVKGERIGVDSSTMEANAALRTIQRRDNGETYRQMLTRMAKESGIETPNAEDLARFDRKRKGKKLSNDDWKSPIDPDAKIARMKDGTTHLAYKPAHAVDLDTGAIVAAPIHEADEGDVASLPKTLEATAQNLKKINLSSLATIRSIPSANGLCSSIATGVGAFNQTSTSLSLVRMKGMAFRTEVQFVHMPAKQASGRSSPKANHTGIFLPLGPVSYSENDVKGTTQRFAGPSQRRQWGEAVLRTLVTPGSVARPFKPKAGEGMPHRAMISSRSPSDMRMIGAG